MHKRNMALTPRSKQPRRMHTQELREQAAILIDRRAQAVGAARVREDEDDEIEWRAACERLVLDQTRRVNAVKHRRA